MKNNIIFPDDFTKHPHHNEIIGGFMWLATDIKNRVPLSIIGSGHGQFGDGVNTFEVYIASEDDILEDGHNRGIYMYQTKEQVQDLINKIN